MSEKNRRLFIVSGWLALLLSSLAVTPMLTVKPADWVNVTSKSMMRYGTWDYEPLAAQREIKWGEAIEFGTVTTAFRSTDPPPDAKIIIDPNCLPENRLYQIHGIDWDKSWLRAVFALLAGIAISVSAPKFWDAGQRWQTERRTDTDEELFLETEHIRDEHEWMIGYGLSKVHSENAMPRDHYYEVLSLLTDGYRSYFDDQAGDASMRVCLFYNEAFGGIKKLLEEDRHADNLKNLYDFWERRASAGECKIYRFHVCSRGEYSRDEVTYGDWYSETFPHIQPFNIATEDSHISNLINGRENDLDFAVLDGGKINAAARRLCIGFAKHRLTYVLIDLADDLAFRGKLLQRALSKIASE